MNEKLKIKAQDPKVDLGDISELFGCQIFPRKCHKLKRIRESFPTAFELEIHFQKIFRIYRRYDYVEARLMTSKNLF